MIETDNSRNPKSASFLETKFVIENLIRLKTLRVFARQKFIVEIAFIQKSCEFSRNKIRD